MTCSNCGDEYSRNTRGSNSPMCKECRRKRHNATTTAWSKAHRDHVNATRRKNYAKHPERYRGYTEKNKLKNPEAVLSRTSRWKRANAEHVREYQRTWIKAHPDRKAAHDRKRRAVKAGVEFEDYGGLEAIFIRDGGRCAWCGKRVSLKGPRLDHLGATVDHVAPLSSGGPDVGWNIVLSCRLCNNRKQAQHPDVLARFEEMKLAR